MTTTAFRLRSVSRLFNRSFSTATATTSVLSRRSSLINPTLIRPLPAAPLSPPPSTLPLAFRTFCTGEDQRSPPEDDSSEIPKQEEEAPPVIVDGCDAQGSPTENDSSDKPKKQKFLLDGCDMEHWFVLVKPPPPDWTRDQIIDSYIKILANVVGSEDEARMKIYSVSTKHYYSFGAHISRELSEKLEGMEGVRWVLPDSYLDIKNKDYGGEPFVDGKAVPYDPKYHKKWVENTQKAKARTDKPRNGDHPSNSDRRQISQGSQNKPRPAGTAQRQGGNPSAPNYGSHGNPGTPPNYGSQSDPSAPPMYGGQGNPGAPPNHGGQGNPGCPNNATPNHQPGEGMQYQSAQMGQ